VHDSWVSLYGKPMTNRKSTPADRIMEDLLDKALEMDPSYRASPVLRAPGSCLLREFAT
jgi:hypothetical protein